jgi:uncharacterized protein YcgI (DUF1989 family)
MHEHSVCPSENRRRSHMQAQQSRLRNQVTSIPVKVEAFCGEKAIVYEITCMHTLPSERLHIIVARQHRLE